MSRSKKNTSNHESQSPALRPSEDQSTSNPPLAGRFRRSRFFWPAIMILVAFGISVYYQNSLSPEVYYKRAQNLLEKEPGKADEQAQLAIDKANGNYPAAQLLQCRALAATNQWDAALGGFTLIRDTSSCNPAELVALAEQAIRSQKFKLAEFALDAARKSERPTHRTFEMLIPLKLQSGRITEALQLSRAWQVAHPRSAQAWSYSGGILATQFDLTAAIADFQEAMKHSPASELEIHIRKSLVQLLADTGDFAGAREELDFLRRAGEIDETLRLKSVQVLRMEGKLDDALAEIENYIKEVGSSSEALKQRGILFLDKGDTDSAIRALKAAVAENDFDKDAHFKLAQAYLRTNQKALAEPHLKRQRELVEATTRILAVSSELEKTPTDAKLREELAELYKKIGRK